jgi:hypothetical protein
MSVDSKLFVTTNKENIIKIMPILLDSLNIYIRKELDSYLVGKPFNGRLQYVFRDKTSKQNKDLLDFSNGVTSCNTSSFNSFEINFTIYGEQRSLFVTHTCSNDYSEIYKGDKIIFSLGCWGKYDEIMKLVANSVKDFGSVYYDFNDCDSEDFIKLN